MITLDLIRIWTCGLHKRTHNFWGGVKFEEGTFRRHGHSATVKNVEFLVSDLVWGGVRISKIYIVLTYDDPVTF